MATTSELQEHKAIGFAYEEELFWQLNVYTSARRPAMTVAYTTEDEARARAEEIAEKGFWLHFDFYPAHTVTRCTIVPPYLQAERISEVQFAGVGLA